MSYSNFPVLDHKMLEDIKSYSKDMLPKIINTYITSANEYLKDMNDAFSVKDGRNIQKISHSLKSISGQVGAKRVYVISSDIEEVFLDREEGEEIDWDKAVSLRGLLQNEMIEAEQQLQKV